VDALKQWRKVYQVIEREKESARVRAEGCGCGLEARFYKDFFFLNLFQVIGWEKRCAGLRLWFSSALPPLAQVLSLLALLIQKYKY
jgi:hypothetical protein